MSRKPRLVLHVGGHKTGTSSLQYFLRRHREAARRLGVRFADFRADPDGAEKGHSQLARAAASGRPAQRAQGRAFVGRCLDAAEGADLTLISSKELNRYDAVRRDAEGFRGQREFAADYMNGTPRYWRRRARQLARIAGLLDPFEVEVWTSLRRPDAFCMSMYQQFVKVRWYAGTAREFAALNHALFDYPRLVGQWADAFPRVRIFVYEDAARRPAGVTGAYLEALGLGDLVPEAQRAGGTNRSLHPYVTEFLRLTNYLPLDKPALRAALAERVDRSGWPDARSLVALGVSDREAFNARWREGCEALRRAHAVPTPGRDTLFDWEVRDDRPVFEGLDMARFEAMARQLGMQPRLLPRPADA